MRLHQSTTEFNAGIDLHGRSLYACMMNRKGEKLVHRKVRDNNLEYLAKLLAPYRHDLTVCCESTFNWYFLADWCRQQGIQFVLGHAAMIRAVHQAKVKNDRVDSETLTNLLRSNMLPYGYACERPWRDDRDLLRRRLGYVHQRGSLKAYLAMNVQTHGYARLERAEKAKGQRRAALVERADADAISLSYTTAVDLIESYDRSIDQIEAALGERAHQTHAEQLEILCSLPGVGPVRSLTLLYEIIDIERFPTAKAFCSFSRVVFPAATSDGKLCGYRGFKQGNPYLKWVFNDLAVQIGNFSPILGAWVEDLERRHGKRAARHRVAHRLANAVYYMLKRHERFSLERFFRGQEGYLKSKT